MAAHTELPSYFAYGLLVRGKRNSAIMKHWALWNFIRYEVVWGVWKGVKVPGLSFGKAIFCMV